MTTEPLWGDLEHWVILNSQGQIATESGWKYPIELFPQLEMLMVKNVDDIAQYGHMAGGKSVRISDLIFASKEPEKDNYEPNYTPKAHEKLPQSSYQTNPGTRRKVLDMREYPRSPIQPQRTENMDCPQEKPLDANCSLRT